MLNMANVHDMLEALYVNNKRESREDLQDLKTVLPVTSVGEYSIAFRDALRQENVIKEGLKENKHNLSPNQVESILLMYKYLVNEALHTGRQQEAEPISRPDAYRKLVKLYDEAEKRIAVGRIYNSDVVFMDRTDDKMYCVYEKEVHIIEL